MILVKSSVSVVFVFVSNRKNFVLLKIYYKDLSTTVTEQLPKYENTGAIFGNVYFKMSINLSSIVVKLTCVQMTHLHCWKSD
jgi:hypothetical protein